MLGQLVLRKSSPTHVLGATADFCSRQYLKEAWGWDESPVAMSMSIAGMLNTGTQAVS